MREGREGDRCDEGRVCGECQEAGDEERSGIKHLSELALSRLKRKSSRVKRSENPSEPVLV
jgi:hypothetical protein